MARRRQRRVVDVGGRRWRLQTSRGGRHHGEVVVVGVGRRLRSSADNGHAEPERARHGVRRARSDRRPSGRDRAGTAAGPLPSPRTYSQPDGVHLIVLVS